jgi:ADP-ribose pyrophosphatase
MMDVNEIVRTREGIYKGSYLSFERWNVELPDGSRAIREIVVPRNAVAIVPIDKDRQIHLVRHCRIAVNDILLEIPAGVIDDHESPEQTARRELVEEIGLFPGTLIQLVTYYHAEGYSTGKITVFLGTELEPRESLHPDHNEFLAHITLPFDEVLNWVPQGKIKDSKTLLGVMLARQWL